MPKHSNGFLPMVFPQKFIATNRDISALSSSISAPKRKLCVDLHHTAIEIASPYLLCYAQNYRTVPSQSREFVVVGKTASDSFTWFFPTSNFEFQIVQQSFSQLTG
jgi:hypothetical protein